jgi:hypothetical protein
MVEEIQKISVRELTTIRIIENGVAHEMSIDVADRFVSVGQQNQSSAPLRALVSSLQQLARGPAGFEIEFVVPFKR